MSHTSRISLTELWLVETLRLQEAHWGPVDDAPAVRQARLGPPEVGPRIVIRARVLAQASGLDRRVAQWRTGAAWAAVLLAILAVMAGVSAAASALGRGAAPVNIIWALGALLGLHTLSFVFWLAGSLWRSPPAAGLGNLWLWLTRKLARAPDRALILPALINLLAQAGARRAALGLISHAWWTLAFAAALMALLAMLSTAHYQFIWATTLLAPERFVTLSDTLGRLPGWLGFPVPAPDVVRQSDGSTMLPAVVQTQWSLWLIGAVVAYGLLPRVLALALCAAQVTRARRRLSVDPTLPGLDALRARLLPDLTPLGDDGISPSIHQPRIGATEVSDPDDWPHAHRLTGTRPLIAALEWPANAPWPPTTADAAENALAHQNIEDAGRLDSRAQRRALLDALAAHPIRKLLLACDAHMTPDRGVIGAVADLSRYAGHTRIWLAPAVPQDTRPARDTQWREQLVLAGLSDQDIVTGHDAGTALRWLAEPADPPPTDNSLSALQRP